MGKYNEVITIMNEDVSNALGQTDDGDIFRYLDSTVNHGNTKKFLAYVTRLSTGIKDGTIEMSYSEYKEQVEHTLLELEKNLSKLLQPAAEQKDLSNSNIQIQASLKNSENTSQYLWFNLKQAMQLQTAGENVQTLSMDQNILNQYYGIDPTRSVSSLIIPKRVHHFSGIGYSNPVYQEIQNYVFTADQIEYSFDVRDANPVDANGMTNSCAAVALGLTRDDMYQPTLRVVRSQEETDKENKAAIIDTIYQYILERLRDYNIGIKQKVVGENKPDSPDFIRSELYFLNEQWDVLCSYVSSYDLAIEKNSQIREQQISKVVDLLQDSGCRAQLDSCRETEFIKQLQDWAAIGLLDKNDISSFVNDFERNKSLAIKQQQQLEKELKTEAIALLYLKARYEKHPDFRIGYSMIVTKDVTNYARAAEEHVVIFNEVGRGQNSLYKLEEYLPSQGESAAIPRDPSVKTRYIVLQDGYAHFKTLLLTQKKNLNFIAGIELWNNLASEVDILNMRNKFLAANSFDGHFFLAELYKTTLEITVSRNVRAPQKLTLKADHLKAVEHFLKARDCYCKEYGAIKITVDGNPTTPPQEYTEMKLDDINSLLRKARTGDPDALYKLGKFYYEEAGQLGIAHAPRVIHVSEVNPKSQLIEMSKACLEAAANRFHPHAADELLRHFREGYDIAKQVFLAHVAADPSDAERCELSADKKSIQFRNYQIPVTNPKNLTTLNAIPQELFGKRNAISNAPLHQVGGIEQKSVTVSDNRCIIPEKHTAYSGEASAALTMPVRQAENTASSRVSSTLPQSRNNVLFLRRMRAQRFGSLGQQASSSSVVSEPGLGASNSIKK